MLSHNAAEIAAHKEWYAEYERLLAAKREAIARWRFERKRREAEARGERLAGGAGAAGGESAGAASDEGDDANEDEQRLLEREERLARLAAWKVSLRPEPFRIFRPIFGGFTSTFKGTGILHVPYLHYVVSTQSTAIINLVCHVLIRLKRRESGWKLRNETISLFRKSSNKGSFSDREMYHMSTVECVSLVWLRGLVE